MILQQLRYICAIVAHDFNISRTAEALHTSQPGISKQIRLLEEELNLDIFLRRRGRIVGLTEPGIDIVAAAKSALRATDNIGAVASDFLNDEVGSLRIAATFTVAKYLLPGVLAKFISRYPRVSLSLLEGDPTSACRMVTAGVADIAVATRPTGDFPELLMRECASLPPVLIAPRDHPLLQKRTPNLAEISKYPFITSNAGSFEQSRIRQKFEEGGLRFNVVFASALNADIVMRFVEAGLGIAILSKNVYDAEREPKLGAIDLGYLFDPRSVCVSIRADMHHRAFVLAFIELLSPKLDQRSMTQALARRDAEAR